ncbi:MAG: UDP-glucose/GDP-mannose dehydrogenase family protein, partial [Caulobacteraceae bacterium]|nr:UDP-glucose/GDP-mannose dehydrogenase family protein [Caulobacteraceae bacterium]
FPKDTLALARTAADAGAPLRLVETTASVNAARKAAMAGKIVAAMGGEVAGRTVAILGLTFKPNTDDMRDAPALEVIPALIRGGARVKAFDPQSHEARRLLNGVEFADGPYEAMDGADALVILTEWDQFRALDLRRVGDLMRTPLIVDLRNIYRPAEVRERGFRYVSLGRP